jgi:hypothetical protein
MQDLMLELTADREGYEELTLACLRDCEEAGLLPRQLPPPSVTMTRGPTADSVLLTVAGVAVYLVERVEEDEVEFQLWEHPVGSAVAGRRLSR